MKLKCSIGDNLSAGYCNEINASLRGLNEVDATSETKEFTGRMGNTPGCYNHYDMLIIWPSLTEMRGSTGSKETARSVMALNDFLFTDFLFTKTDNSYLTIAKQMAQSSVLYLNENQYQNMCTDLQQ